MPAARHTIPGALLLALLAAAIAAIVAGAASLAAQSSTPPLGPTVDAAVQGHRFSLVDFEFQTLFNNWLGEAGALFTGRRNDDAEAGRMLYRYFRLGDQISALATAEPEGPTLTALRAERGRLENRAEGALESRVAAALRQAGFSRSLPLFDTRRLLWPPVDLELTGPPRILVVSPRDEIRLVREVLLQPDLSPAAIARIEALIEDDGRFSALVQGIGGLAAYPAIVREGRSYAATVNLAAHEWVHHYLFFFPLGRAFNAGRDARTINETVADLVAAEIDDLVFAAAPLPSPASPPSDRAASDAVLRRLRTNVDALLAEGRVEAAERLMEDGRLELAALGRHFRRLNQAFFAFNGVYADTPASASPIGPLLCDLRGGSPSLLAFVEAVREITSLAGLEALLAERP